MKTGLVLEGGGVRGIYTAGVLDVFMEHSLTFDGVIGVSAGAVHGISYMSGQKGRSIRYYTRYASDPRFMSVKSLLKTGNIVGVDFCYHELPDKLDIFDHEAFRANKVPFYTVCTDVETGQPAYCRVTDSKAQIDYVRASATLPYVSKIVEFEGKKYLDGGCSDSIPVEAFMKMGYGRNVLILTRPADYVRRPERRVLAGLYYRKYPALVKSLRERHDAYNQTMARIAELEQAGTAFVIRPAHALEIGRLENDPQRIRAIYDLGYADGEACMERLKGWLAHD